jgi:hypothetical protein
MAAQPDSSIHTATLALKGHADGASADEGWVVQVALCSLLFWRPACPITRLATQPSVVTVGALSSSGDWARDEPKRYRRLLHRPSRFSTRCQIELRQVVLRSTSTLRLPSTARDGAHLTIIRRCRNRSRNPQLGGNPMPFLACAAPPR